MPILLNRNNDDQWKTRGTTESDAAVNVLCTRVVLVYTTLLSDRFIFKYLLETLIILPLIFYSQTPS